MKALDSMPSLTERVYRAIADSILDGALEPGMPLVQEQLAADLGVSRQPVQQAMALLKADGLVEEAGRRGLAVTALDLARMGHHYELRAELDGYAARKAAGLRDARAFAAEAEAVLAAGRRLVAEGAPREQIAADEGFHQLIYRWSGNPALEETVAPNWRYLRRAMAEVLRHAEPAEAIWDQHAAIAAAIAAGDAAGAEALARDHVTTAAARLIAAVKAMAP